MDRARAPKSGTGSGTRGARKPASPEAQFVEVDEVEDVPTFGEQSVPRPKLVEKPQRISNVDAKAGAPSLDEWQDFFGRFVLKLLVDAYLYMVLGDLWEELTPAEADRIKLSPEDMKEIAAPLAEMSNKSSYMKKHGRTIIAAAESYESILTLLLWMNRVNRIARKHKKNNPNYKQRTRTVRARRTAAPQPQPERNTPDAQHDGFDSGQVNGVGVNGLGIYNPGSG